MRSSTSTTSLIWNGHLGEAGSSNMDFSNTVSSNTDPSNTEEFTGSWSKTTAGREAQMECTITVSGD